MKKRKVIQYTMDYEPVRVFDSVKEAEEYCHISHISSVCRYRRRSDISGDICRKRMAGRIKLWYNDCCGA